jgi:hypothetical protein
MIGYVVVGTLRFGIDLGLTSHTSNGSLKETWPRNRQETGEYLYQCRLTRQRGRGDPLSLIPDTRLITQHSMQKAK